MSYHYLDPIAGLVHDASGPADAPPVVFLPGAHGDPRLLERARPHLNRSLHLIEVTYPRAAGWSLAHYARSLEDLLDVLDLPSAHIVAESFGSLIGWEFGLHQPSRVRSLVLAGGFCRPVETPGLHLARRALTHLPTAVIERGADLFLRRRGVARAESDLDWPGGVLVAGQSARPRRAAAERLRLVAETDFTPHLNRVRFPVRYIGGSADEAINVRGEVRHLANRLPASASFEARLFAGAPHGILCARPADAGEQIVEWITGIEATNRKPSSE